jgi:hypothetical protein
MLTVRTDERMIRMRMRRDRSARFHYFCCFFERTSGHKQLFIAAKQSVNEQENARISRTKSTTNY